MGIHGYAINLLQLRLATDSIYRIYKEIGPGRRVALSKLAAEHYIAHSHPFRLAIDISIWLFQIQSGKGGSNPALRTFYYRLLRLLSLNIHPLFVFDGPNKPTFKRHKRVGGPNVKVSSIPEFLAKQLLKHFGFPLHHAPGEAEAECALLQREGIVDGVLSEDVDTLMFGSGLTLRSWTPEAKSSKVPTHVNVYDAEKTKEGSGLDRPGMILIAMMSGGDYIPEGIPGCGPKLACEAARAGFGAELCGLRKGDTVAIDTWRERLRHEIRTNESKFFKQKRTALTIPDDFPHREVLRYYTHPVISGPEKIAKLKDTLKWDLPLDYPSLRDFAADAFDWRCLGGAKKFIRNLAPAVLIRELRLRGELADDPSDGPDAQGEAEAALISGIHGKRTHASTDNTLELRISFVPINLVNIDLSIEEADEELPADEEDSDSEPPPSQQMPDDEGECPGSPKKTRAASAYDPTVHEKAWFLDTWIRLGAPLKVQDWEGAHRDAQSYLAAKQAAKAIGKTTRARQTATKGTGGMQRGALDRFTQVTKSGISWDAQNTSVDIEGLDLSGTTALPKSKKNVTRPVPKNTTLNGFTKVTKAGVNRSFKSRSADIDEIDLSKINAIANERAVSVLQALPKSSLNRPNPATSQTLVDELDLSKDSRPQPTRRQPKRPSPEPASPYSVRTGDMARPRKVTKQHEVIDLLSSSPVRPVACRVTTPPPPDIRHVFRRDEEHEHNLDVSDLPDTVTRRRKKSPGFKRYQSAPTAGEDIDMPSPTLRATISCGNNTFKAIDLASAMTIPSSPNSLPSPTIFRPAGSHETFLAAFPTRKSPTPDNVAPISFDPSLSMPSPSLDDEEDEGPTDIIFPTHASALRQPVSAIDLLLQNKRFNVRKNPLPTPSTSVSSADSLRDTPDLLAPGPQKQSRIAGKIKKTYVQPRESLPGRWKEIEVEEMDLSHETNEAAPTHRNDGDGRRMYRKSGVEMVDLTED